MSEDTRFIDDEAPGVDEKETDPPAMRGISEQVNASYQIFKYKGLTERLEISHPP
jgi:hypothetical protein